VPLIPTVGGGGCGVRAAARASPCTWGGWGACAAQEPGVCCLVLCIKVRAGRGRSQHWHGRARPRPCSPPGCSHTPAPSPGRCTWATRRTTWPRPTTRSWGSAAHGRLQRLGRQRGGQGGADAAHTPHTQCHAINQASAAAANGACCGCWPGQLQLMMMVSKAQSAKLHAASGDLNTCNRRQIKQALRQGRGVRALLARRAGRQGGVAAVLCGWAPACCTLPLWGSSHT
jgi:hypothetical protein